MLVSTISGSSDDTTHIHSSIHSKREEEKKKRGLFRNNTKTTVFKRLLCVSGMRINEPQIQHKQNESEGDSIDSFIALL